MHRRFLVISVTLAMLLSACAPAAATFPPSTDSPKNTSESRAITASSPVSPLTVPSVNSTLTVHFIDVGQGDSILIDYGQTEILIDGGEKNTGVADYIRPYVDGALEAMVATHPHADHIGGLLEVLQKYDVKDIWLNGDTYSTKTYTDFMNLVSTENATVHQGRTWTDNAGWST